MVYQGQGPAIVFLHGWASSWHHWRLTMPRVAQAGFAVYAPDLLGHGDSVKPDSAEAYPIQAYLDSLSDWLDDRRLDRPLLVGHSLGGYLSLAFARRWPERVAGLFLVNPLYTPIQLGRTSIWQEFEWQGLRLPRLGEFFFRYTPEWLIRTTLDFHRHDTGHLPFEFRHQVARDYKRASPHIVHTIFSIDDLRPDLPEIRVPAVVIWGDRDLTLNPTSFPPLVERLPEAQGYCFPGRGHSPHLAEIDHFHELLLSFAQRRLR